MFENPRRGRHSRNFTTNAPKILDLKSSSEQILSRKLPLGAPAISLSDDSFADVTLWDMNEATPESSLNDLTDNEIEID